MNTKEFAGDKKVIMKLPTNQLLSLVSSGRVKSKQKLILQNAIKEEKIKYTLPITFTFVLMIA